MKEQFTVDEEGYDQVEEEEAENIMASFIDYVKTNKVRLMTTAKSYLSTQFSGSECR